MKSLWVTPNESQTDGRGVAAAAGAEGDGGEEEEEVTKVMTLRLNAFIWIVIDTPNKSLCK